MTELAASAGVTEQRARSAVRELVSAAQKTRRLIEFEIVRIVTCGGCGVEIDSYTDGCARCQDRRASRRLRADPGRWARELQRASARKYDGPSSRRCRGCGCGWNEITDGCRTCCQRGRKRPRVAA